MHTDRDGVPIYIPELDRKRQEDKAEAMKALAEEIVGIIRDQYLSDPPDDIVTDILSYLDDETTEEQVIECLGTKIVIRTTDEDAARDTALVNWRDASK